MSDFEQYFQALVAVGRDFGCKCNYGAVEYVERADEPNPGALVPHRRDCPVVASLVAG
jgi:hypothetical protein